MSTKQPAEQAIAFADRHGDQLANVRVEPRRRAGRRAIQHERLGGHARAKPLDEPAKFRFVERAIAVRDQHGLHFHAPVHRILLVEFAVAVEPDGDALGRHDFGQPVHRQAAQIGHALGDRQVLGEPVEQRDFFERRQQVRRQIGQLPLELGLRLLQRRLFDDGRGDFLHRVRMPGRAGLSPLEGLRGIHAEFVRRGPDLFFALDRLGNERRHSHQHRLGRIDGQRHRQQQQRRNFVDDFRPAPLRNFVQRGHALVRIDGQLIGGRANNVASGRIDH